VGSSDFGATGRCARRSSRSREGQSALCRRAHPGLGTSEGDFLVAAGLRPSKALAGSSRASASDSPRTFEARHNTTGRGAEKAPPASPYADITDVYLPPADAAAAFARGAIGRLGRFGIRFFALAERGKVLVLALAKGRANSRISFSSFHTAVHRSLFAATPSSSRPALQRREARRASLWAHGSPRRGLDLLEATRPASISRTGSADRRPQPPFPVTPPMDWTRFCVARSSSASPTVSCSSPIPGSRSRSATSSGKMDARRLSRAPPIDTILQTEPSMEARRKALSTIFWFIPVRATLLARTERRGIGRPISATSREIGAGAEPASASAVS